MTSLTLTRAEAVAIESLLVWTDGGFLLNIEANEPEGVEAAIRRLQLEAAIREGGAWWEHDHDSSPGMLNMREQLGRLDGYPEYSEATCPETFTLPAEAARALAVLLPIAFGDALDDDRETVLGVAARLGVEIAQAVAS